MEKHPFLWKTLILTALLVRGPLSSEDLPLRTLHVRVAVDSDLESGENWRTDINGPLRDAFFSFRTRFGIQIKIKEVTTWHPNPDSNSSFDLLSSLEKEVRHEGCDTVLGIASPKYNFGGRPGVSCCRLNYILVQYLNSKRDLKFVMRHELCHLFGAVDLREKNSIMSSHKLGYEFDDFTSKVILLNRNRVFYQGSPLFAAEKREEAISVYRGRAELNLGEAELNAMLALLYYEMKNYTSASEQCAQALALDPGCLAASTILGHARLAQGDIDGAIAQFKKVLTAQRGSPILRYNLGVALSEKGQTGEAIAEFQEAIRAKPDYVEAYANMASAYLKKGEVDLSIRSCRAALGLNADLPEVLYALSLGLILKWEALKSSPEDGPAGILEEAISSCQTSVRLKPDLAEAHNLMGAAYEYAEKSDLAEAEFVTALELKPQLATAHLNLGLMYFQRKQYEKSAYHIRQILETNPSSGIGLELLISVFKGTKRYDLLKAR